MKQNRVSDGLMFKMENDPRGLGDVYKRQVKRRHEPCRNPSADSG